MTPGQLQRNARDVAIACARRGGLPYAVIAIAHELSEGRVKAIARAMAERDALKTALVGILIALEEQRVPSRAQPKNRTRRAATL